jgi:hypothetical protein
MGLLYLYLALNIFAALTAGREGYPQNYFKAPLNIPLTLAGNFGEPRKLHFHMGLDLKTNEHTGLQVFAAAKGYISRINVSGTGYGNALYITHPNGYVTVYGHLQEFAAPIQERLRKEQFTRKSFAVDFDLKPDEFPVKQGDLIALSGNTGGSGGPHLHFEIRDSDERALNPLLFGLQVKDDMPPAINYLKFYPMDELKYKSNGYEMRVSAKNGQYEVAGGIVKLNASAVGISVNTFDVINLSENHIGIYDMKLYDDEALIFELRMDKMSFDENRAVLSQIDYPAFLSEGFKTYQKCFKEPDNPCPIYFNLVKRGIIDLSDNLLHDIRIEVSDFAGDTSKVHFKLEQDMARAVFKPKELNYLKRFDYNANNEFENADIKLKIPKGCLFDTVYFNYSSSLSTDAAIFSKVHQVGSSSTQCYSWFNIALKAEKLNSRFKNKAVIVFKDITGEEVSRGGTFDNGFITARAREFGTYYIKIDTTAPQITPVNIAANKNMKAAQKIVFKISDNLSGIAGYDTYVDSNWVVSDYDAKTSTITYRIDSKLNPGSHGFKVVAHDERENMAEYSVKFKL